MDLPSMPALLPLALMLIPDHQGMKPTWTSVELFWALSLYMHLRGHPARRNEEPISQVKKWRLTGPRLHRQ